MQTSCGQIFALILLVITNLAVVIAFATPYWAEMRIIGQNRGLWANCDSSDCTWVFDDDFRLQKMRPDWFQASQVLMSVGLGLTLVSLLIATLSLCCTCHSCNPHHPVCILLVLSCIVMGVAVTVFGVNAHQDWMIEMQWEFDALGRFGWSFWVAIGASVMALITGIVYGCIGRNRH